MTQTDEQPPKIDWPSVFAGAGAAVTVAVLLSTLGAAGTLVGAAMGSAVATVSTALYKRGIQSSRRRMAEVQASALQRVGQAQQEVRRAALRSDSSTVAADLARADAHLDGASSELTENDEEPPAVPAPLSVDPAPPGAHAAPESALAGLPWRRIALLTGTVFVIAMLAISGFELLAGKSVSSLTGGTTTDKRTSVTGLFGDTSGTKRQPTPTPSPTVTATVTTSAPATSQAPTTSAAPTEQPSDTATASDTASATDSATVSTSATASAAPAAETGSPTP